MAKDSGKPSISNVFETSLFMGTPEINWDSVTAGHPLRQYKKNQIIFRQETPCEFVYIVKRGRVRLEICGANGNTRNLFVAEAGTIIGEQPSIDNRFYLFNATASSDCLLYVIPVQDFQNALEADHKLAMAMLQIMSKKMRLMSMLIKQLSFNDSYYRVAYALVNVAQQYSALTPEGWYKLNIKFTHQEMADLTGLSRVSVSNIMLEMTADGFIEKDTDGYLIVKRLDRLGQLLTESGQ